MIAQHIMIVCLNVIVCNACNTEKTKTRENISTDSVPSCTRQFINGHDNHPSRKGRIFQITAIIANLISITVYCVIYSSYC